MKKKNKEEDMSQTFIAEVGQKSAIAEDSDIEELKPIDNKNDDKNDDFNESKNKKNNIGGLIIAIILSLIVGAGGSYYFFSVQNVKEIKSTKKLETNQKNTDIKEEINPEGIFAKSLISRYDFSIISEVEIYDYLYSKDKITVDEIDEDYIRLLAASNIKRDLTLGNFSSEELENSTNMLFGNQIELENEDFTVGCTKYKYSNVDKYYTREESSGCGGASSIEMKRKIVKSVFTDDKTLEINVAIAIVNNSNDTVYKKYNKDLDDLGEDKLDNVDATTFDIDKDYKKLNQYKYTFNYDNENNNYYLVSIELIK